MRHLAIEDILPPDILNTLSPAMQRLYGIVWNAMATAGSTSVTLGDADVSKRARVTLQQLPAAQSELSQSGLMILSPAQGATRYEFPDDPVD